jgi:hypothetical protein
MSSLIVRSPPDRRKREIKNHIRPKIGARVSERRSVGYGTGRRARAAVERPLPFDERLPFVGASAGCDALISRWGDSGRSTPWRRYRSSRSRCFFLAMAAA